jgi:hypothetical protein
VSRKLSESYFATGQRSAGSNARLSRIAGRTYAPVQFLFKLLIVARDDYYPGKFLRRF